MKKIKLPIICIIIFSYFLFFVSGVSADSSITASSIETEARAASYVFDNNTQTRWSSRFSDPQWLEMDLGEIKDMVGMTLYWETAYGKSYDISISPDKKEWSKVYSTTEGDGEIDDIYFGRKKARYIKILCKERATQWGYSLWEIRIKDLNDEILVKASSSEGANVAANAMDGNRETLWHSGKNDAALIELETKKKKNIGGIFLNWGEDYATAYYIDVSSNGKNWTTVYKRIGGTGGLDKIYVNIMGKPYIRIRCENSDKGKGYAMKEIDLKDWEDIAKHSSLDKARGLAGWESCRWKTFVGKDGSFAAQPYPFQVTFWAYDYSTEKLYTPETIKTSWRLMEGGFPVTIVSWNSNDIETTTTIFSRWDEAQGKLLTFARASLKNNGSEDKAISLYAVIRPNSLYKKWNVQDIKEIEYDGSNSVKINGAEKLFLLEKGNAPLGSSDNKELLGVKIMVPGQKIVGPYEGAKGAILLYKENFKVGEKRDFDVIVPSGDGKELAFEDVKGFKFEENLKYAINYWKNRAPLKLNLPDKKYTDCFYSSLYYILIMNNEENKLYPGPYEYTTFFLHDAVDIDNALDKVGLKEIAEKATSHFNYKEGNGYIDELGGSIFALYEHYRLTKNKEFLSNVYSRIRDGCQLIKTLRARQMSEDLKDSAVYGLLPKGISQDNFKIPANLYVDNWWAIIGLKAGIEAAKILNKEEDVAWIKQEYEGLLNSTLTSIERVMKKESLPHMPAFADYWPKEMRIVDGEHRILGDAQMAWAHRPALFPGQNMGITIPLEFFANSYKQYWQRAGKFSGYDGGWFVEYEKVFWGYNPKLAHPLIYLGMNDVALKNIRWSIEHQSCPGGWAEATPAKINKKGLWEIDEGIIGDVPHGWSAAHYILFLRDMLLREDNDKLILLSCVPENWLDDGKIIEIEDAPTYFGNVSFKVVSFKGRGYLKISLDAKTPPPKGYVLTVLNKKVEIPPQIKEIQVGF